MQQTWNPDWKEFNERAWLIFKAVGFSFFSAGANGSSAYF